MTQIRRTIANRATLLTLVGLATWFLTAALAMAFDPGPDWFDTKQFPHVDAALLASMAALAVAVGLGAWLARPAAVQRQ